MRYSKRTFRDARSVIVLSDTKVVQRSKYLFTQGMEMSVGSKVPILDSVLLRVPREPEPSYWTDSLQKRLAVPHLAPTSSVVSFAGEAGFLCTLPTKNRRARVPRLCGNLTGWGLGWGGLLCVACL